MMERTKEKTQDRRTDKEKEPKNKFGIKERKKIDRSVNSK